MPRYAEKLRYTGSHFADIAGSLVSTSEIADHVDRSRQAVRATLHVAGSFERGCISDEDLRKYLPSAAERSKHRASLALMAMVWA